MSGWNPHQQKIVDGCLEDFAFLIAHEKRVGYHSARPYPQPTRHQVVDLGWQTEQDCTSLPKLVICGWHGVPVFDGRPNGFGDTATFFKGPKVYHVPFSPKYWQPLDLVLYKDHVGPFRGGADEHCTVLTHKVAGHWHVCSHGTDSGPADKAWDYRDDAVAVIRFPIPLK